MAPPAEISIPSTILSTGESKPYTLYNITLRLPLKSFVVQKRYSDFAALHQTLSSLVDSPPPKPLPGKSWFKSTVSSPELTEQRRQGLEAYLRAIAESPDRRWRDTTAWRAFLNLPSTGVGSTSNSAASAHGLITSGRAGAADPTTWLDLHREMKACLHDARNQLARRDGAVDSNNSTAAAEAGAAAKRSLIKAGTLVNTLTDGLRAMQEGGRLGEGELRRRRDLLSSARVEREGLDKLSNSMAQGTGRSGGGGREGWASAGDKAALLGGSRNGGARTGGRVLGAPLPENERTRELDNSGVVQLQQQMMSEQDEQVNVLAAIVRRQKQMGLQINEEVVEQTKMLDRLNEDAERVGGKIDVAKKRVGKF
ncbi:PX domain-containing protein [Colletotrichum eremochloae]|uniref:Putative PX domain-containing protein n=1 Tax=Colletotrichum sublineola TaxID=1173701 RepID=A0A066X394_COLSU|nr:PX domain-containing protein [Colletotrichum sublineola]KAK2017668.1 PX domain-containing protein [Colletotrichum eremochloae]KDN60171.1 putative PX domain-containing protein [Colletotrichum sublineola]